MHAVECSQSIASFELVREFDEGVVLGRKSHIPKLPDELHKAWKLNEERSEHFGSDCGGESLREEQMIREDVVLRSDGGYLVHAASLLLFAFDLLLFGLLQLGAQHELLLELLLEVVLGPLADIERALNLGNHIRLFLGEADALR